MDKARPHVLISGAGIAGLVLAYWLLRAGVRVTVIERAPEMRLSGQSIDIRQSAVDVIRSMGLEDAIRQKTTTETGLSFVDASGKAFATFEATGSTEVQSITSEFEILRGDLTTVFYEAVQRLGGAEFIFGDYVTGTRQTANGSVEVTFAKRAEPATYGLVVGADGLGSKLRKMTFDAASAKWRPLGGYVAFFTIEPNLLQDSNGLARFHQMPLGRSVLLRPDQDGHTRVVISLVVGSGDTAEEEGIKAAFKAGGDSVRQLIQSKFASAGWVIPQVIEEMGRSDDFYYTEIAQVISDQLHKDGVVLAGDAGYCPTAFTGMGTSLAIIGAYILAGEIARHPDDLRAAAQRYQETMLPYAKKVQQLPPGVPQAVNPQTPWGLSFANAILMSASWLKLDKLASKFSGIPFLSRSQFKLPEYQWPQSGST